MRLIATSAQVPRALSESKPGMSITHRLVIMLGIALLVSVTPVALLASPAYSFQSVANPNDPAFTQLLGINNTGTIAGYWGDGSVIPNNGFTLVLPNNFTPENFPGSAQTQVVGINAAGNTAGFYIDNAGATHGFTDIGSVFNTVDNPNSANFTQLLGINSSNETAGYWQDNAGNQFAFTEMGGSFSDLTSLLGNPTIAQATGVNNAGVVAGFFMDNAGIFHGFLLSGNVETVLDVPGAVLTQAFGLNNAGQVVGDYIDLSMVMHGFIYNIGTGTFATVDDPLGAGTTTINGINDLGQIVGFYVDGNDNTIGFVGTPTPEPASLLLLGTGLLGMVPVVRRRIGKRG